MGRRAWLADQLERAGVTSMLLGLQHVWRSDWIPILTFHRIGIDDDGPTPFDDGVHDVHAKSFVKLLATVRAHFTPITTLQLERSFAGAPLPRNPMMITFDDGYRDNFEIALPLLRAHGVTATFFIATHFVSERRMFWWDRIAYLIKQARRDRIELAYPEPRTLALGEPGSAARARAVRELQALVKTRFALDLERFLADLARSTGVAWSDDLERSFADEHVMTWDQVRELRDAGMDLASHTHEHRVIQTLRPDDLARDLAASREAFERELGLSPRAISYPVGGDLVGEDPRRALHDAGFGLGFTYRTGAQPFGGTDRYAVHRIALDLDTAPALTRAILAAPAVFARPTRRDMAPALQQVQP